MTLSPRERETIMDFHRAGLCLPEEHSCVCLGESDTLRDTSDMVSGWIEAACEVYPEIDPDMMKKKYGKMLTEGTARIDFSDVMALAEKLSPAILKRRQSWGSR